MRVARGRVVATCRACAGRACAGGPAEVADSPRRAGRASTQTSCSLCGDELPLFEARPVTAAAREAAEARGRAPRATTGGIALACLDCLDAPTQPLESEPDGAQAAQLLAGHAAAERYRRITAGAAMVVALSALGLYLSNSTPPRAAVADSLKLSLAVPSAPMIDQDIERVPSLDGHDTGEEDADEMLSEEDDPGLFEPDSPLPPTLDDERENSEEPLHERFPTLNGWVFPVLGSDEEFPLKATRRFGAVRHGVRENGCGDGHCGVDLGGPRGTPVAAVAWGIVTRIERRSDRSSGKYVRVEHPDYVYTAYMHLDDIAEDLQIGDEVDAGDVLGTLGRTGIHNSAPHLHFNLSIPEGGRLVPIDPAPYLLDAERVAAD
ncbi:M23 family metallopeptidase [Haliangium ochraceum]|uniref:M23 family metallopeptidase n=1 Tax=Haliangium ochraceum TaxID=80816 RepID=UPI00019BAE61|nr:M23 family metallopeptidase [Haliangium ochraceum]